MRVAASTESFLQRNRLNSKMRSIICILTLLCTVYALEQGDKIVEQVANLQKITEIILGRLLIFEERTKQNLNTKLYELEIEALGDIYDTINEAFKNFNLSVSKGKQQGKEVKECYNFAKNKLELGNISAINELKTCIQNGHTAMAGPLANVVNSIEAAKKLLIDLDDIIPNCYSTNIIKTQICIIKGLILSKLSLNRISGNAKEVIRTAEVIYAKTIIDTRSCTTTNTANIHTLSTDIVVYIDNCIRNIPEDVPKPSTTKLPPIILKSVV